MHEGEALELLGLEKCTVNSDQLTADVLRKSYLRAALATHPDKNKADPTASQKFTQLKSAYELLSQNLQDDHAAKLERDTTAQLLALLLRALRGDDVQSELRDLGVYRPSEEFGIDLSVSFDRRLPPSIHDAGNLDLGQAFREAFLDEGLDENGDPLCGWARPPIDDSGA